MKCLLENWGSAEKRIKAICKKLDKYGVHYDFSREADTIEEITVYKVEAVDHFGTKYSETKAIGTYPMDVVNFSFEVDTLKLGDWLAIAVIEHSVTDNGTNIVHMIDTQYKPLSEWNMMNAKCEHCNHTRARSKTVILKDECGNLKQVGTTCIKDFTGFDGLDLLKAYMDIKDIFMRDLSYTCNDNNDNNGSIISKYVSTSAFFACCIDEILKNGYQKDFTKSKAINSYLVNNKQASEKATAEALKVIEFFRQFDSLDDIENELGYKDSSFYWNIASALSGEYCRPNGFVAYAYISYQKAVEELEKRKLEADQRAALQYQHSIGEKVNLELIYTQSVEFENNYNGGYSIYSISTSYFHFFKDEAGNIYKWSTAKRIGANMGAKLIISGTVKAHDLYKGEKQTVLTRCKIA